ncbi:aspartyl protease family protein [Phenylobacterium sp.]|uniref:aspartyl protease family protein n=1 Tax=Phenylobacterium sp. TaxID=1871053 RepID=UPI00356736F2
MRKAPLLLPLAVWALTCGFGPRPAALGIPRASCAGWPRAGVIEMAGEIKGGGLDGAVSLTLDPARGRWRQRKDYGGMSTAAGFDGTLAWAQDVSGGSHGLDSDFARRTARSQAWIARRGWCRPDAGDAVIGPPRTIVEAGRTLSVWRVKPRGGSPVELWIDAATGLPQRFVEQLSENRLVHTYSGWTTLAGGVRVATVERIDDPEDEESETLTFATIERRGRPAEAAFARPPAPADHRILGGARSATVVYEADLDRIYVPVLVDGQGPYPFELDTGGHLILTPDTAKALSLDAAGAFSSTGGGQGVVKAGFAKVRELRIGDAVLYGQSAKVLPLNAASSDRGARPPRAGLLGLELFERFAVHLDRRGHTMTLTPLKAFRHAGAGTALPLRFTEDAPQTRGAVLGRPGELELDTGNAGPAIVEGRWAADHGLAARFATGVVTSGSGVGGDYRQTVGRAALALGPHALPGELVSYVGVVERGSESMRDIAANLGEPILSQFDVTFDYGRRVVWLDPLPARAPRAFNRAGLSLAKVGSEPFKVTLVIAGSPADRAGIKAGERVTAIDGQPAAAMAAFEAKQRFLGPVGSAVRLAVQAADGGAREVRLILADLVP